jgi:L-threonylcarbamoyladenylate synthase
MSDRSTIVRRIDPVHPEAELLQEAAEMIRAGGLVAFPTETVYGLGANALDPAAVAGIFEAKGRPATNPLIVHVDGEAMLRQVVAKWPATAADFAARFWPGPLTLVLVKSPEVPDIVTGGGPTVAVRMPAHPVALGLIRAGGVPLAAPSANRSSQLSPTRAEHVLSGLGGRVDLILDGGPAANGIESTVESLAGERPELLRPGPITPAELEGVLGRIARRTGIDERGPLPSPGMLPRHYAPRTPVELFPNVARLIERANELAAAGKSAGVVLLTDSGMPAKISRMPANAPEYAARLYGVLHDLDARRLDHILIELPPETNEWLAVRDRLARAAQ